MNLEEYIESIKTKKICILGAGISNRPLIRILCQHGIIPEVRDRSEVFSDDISDLNFIYISGEKYLDNIDADIIFRSPSILPNRKELKEAFERGSIITSEIEVVFQLCPSKIIAVTGSDGKTTTTTIISKLLKEAGYKVFIGGNIGFPLLTSLPEMTSNDFVVLELSSFQLHSMNCRPQVAVITNLSPNHLDVHKDYADYINAKKNVYRNMNTGILVLNADNQDSMKYCDDFTGETRLFSSSKKIRNGCYYKESQIISACDYSDVSVLTDLQILIPGQHNIENYMAAYCAVRDYISVSDLKKVAESFNGVNHRLQPIRKWHDIIFYNDSIASSPSRTIAGLKCFKEKVILIAGGKDKGIAYDSLGPYIVEHVKKIVVTGNTAKKIVDSIKNTDSYTEGSPEIFFVEDFKEAVLKAVSIAVPGDKVILSPASTSFDRFKNFEERGNYFKNIIDSLDE